ncbi:MAG: hypothetical protein BV456_07560 [Thermoplasmata archaeon M8B2D]|nr:MAG: hypothetical protein BV456_07560 [Thermoplasmata archaeon M8B2D]
MPKGKRQTPESKLTDMIKKRIGHRTNPSTCSNCLFSEIVECDGKPMTCSVAQEFVKFGVSEQESCERWSKKRKKREKKEKTGESKPKKVKKDKKKELPTILVTETQK